MTEITSIVKSIQDIMRKDAGVDGDAQRLGQLGWILFFKILCDQEKQLLILNKNYKSVIPKNLHWDNWAKNKEGITGDELIEFINNNLFHNLKNLTINENKLSKVVKSIFKDSFNYMKSGVLLRQLINKLNLIDFNKLKDKNAFGHIYETILRDLQSAGNAGEFYTPRAVTNFIINCLRPDLGQKILDPATGTGGFLTGVINYLRKNSVKTLEDEKILQNNIFGVEKKSLPHLLCSTNLLLHGFEDTSNVRHDNTLERPLIDYGSKDQVDIVATNPPFGGSEEDGIEKNFPAGFRTRETASLFLILIIRILKKNGKCGIILPDGFMSGEKVKAKIKKYLLNECNLHTIIRLQPFVFYPYTNIPTNILFFDKSLPTKEIWYYEQPYPTDYKYTKTQFIKEEEFKQTLEWFKNKKKTKNSWKVNIEEIKNKNYDLDFKNPNSQNNDKELEESNNAIDELIKNFEQANVLLNELKKDLK